MSFLGGMIDNRLVSNKEIKECIKMPSIDVMQGQLCGLLSSVTASTRNLLQSHQTNLTMSLDQYIKDNFPNDSE